MIKVSRFKKPQEYETEVLEIKRVTRVIAGGKRFSFRAAVIIGNKKGKVGLGLAKANDVKKSVEKAAARAKKNLTEIPLYSTTIFHQVSGKFSAAKVLLKPARPGTGIIAGGALRPLIILSGIKDISAKILGHSSNKINNVKAALLAFGKLKVLKRTTDQEEAKINANTPA